MDRWNLAPFLAHAAGSDVLSVVVAGAESAVLHLRTAPLLSAFASHRPRPEAPGFLPVPSVPATDLATTADRPARRALRPSAPGRAFVAEVTDIRV
ncbi:hypothetical protein [Streptomyces sp. NPDC050982]|uniref:hypothetical protein n=1 Tax=Streptomyces sp. NPDC050982 TaxID=3154746 RepID=UPI0033F0E17D